jgi:hypothetical protein
MNAAEAQFGFSVEKGTLNGQSIPAGTLQIAPSGSKTSTSLSVDALDAIEGAYQYARSASHRISSTTESPTLSSPNANP